MNRKSKKKHHALFWVGIILVALALLAMPHGAHGVLGIA